MFSYILCLYDTRISELEENNIYSELRGKVTLSFTSTCNILHVTCTSLYIFNWFQPIWSFISLCSHILDNDIAASRNKVLARPEERMTCLYQSISLFLNAARNTLIWPASARSEITSQICCQCKKCSRLFLRLPSPVPQSTNNSQKHTKY